MIQNGIAYIITNKPGKTRDKFARLCNKSILHARRLEWPICVISLDADWSSKNIKADYHIDGNKYLNQYENIDLGLPAAEIIKTYICDWSPFEKTLYFDCDAFLVSRAASLYVDILDSGYELSLSTCASMGWKDAIESSPIQTNIFDEGILPCFPYWNFGVFGVKKESKLLMERIRKNFLKYANNRRDFNSNVYTIPHAQPAIVNTAYQLGPNHKIFTMPARYNCHFPLKNGYVFSGEVAVLHMWKDMRDLITYGWD